MTAKNKSDELPDSPVGALLKLYKSRIKKSFRFSYQIWIKYYRKYEYFSKNKYETSMQDLAPQQVSDLFIESLEAAIELEKQELGEILIIDPGKEIKIIEKYRKF